MGSFNASVAADYTITDGTETVTFTATRNGTTSHYAVQFADPHSYTQREIAASGGFFQAGDRQWTLGAAQLPAGFTPMRGDNIAQSSGATWELIENGVIDDFGVSWVCPTRKAR
jgi:hypothetical protein